MHCLVSGSLGGHGGRSGWLGSSGWSGGFGWVSSFWGRGGCWMFDFIDEVQQIELTFQSRVAFFWQFSVLKDLHDSISRRQSITDSFLDNKDIQTNELLDYNFDLGAAKTRQKLSDDFNGADSLVVDEVVIGQRSVVGGNNNVFQSFGNREW